MADGDDVPEGFTDVTEYVETHLEFATSHYNDSYLQRRIKSRMRRTGVETYPAYLNRLREDSEEGDRLLESLSINVTGFFRNPEVWDGIRTLLRNLTEEHRSVRVWSAACADGREPYSLAMIALDDPQIPADSITIRGTDINEHALIRARNAVYESNHTSDLDEQLQYLTDYSPYVQRNGDRFRVTDRVTQLVTFEQNDIIRDQTPGRHELVICRNLFIYIDPKYKEPVIRSIEEGLVDEGYLVIGKAETIPREASNDFIAIDNEKRIYQVA